MLLDNYSKNDLVGLYKSFMKILPLEQIGLLNSLLNNKKVYQVSKMALISIFTNVYTDPLFMSALYESLMATETSRFIYSRILWKNLSMKLKEVPYPLNRPDKDRNNYSYDNNMPFEEELCFIHLHNENSYWGNTENDFIFIPWKKRLILKSIFPKPDDYDLLPLEKLNDTDFHYSNESDIVYFVHIISEMAKNDLIKMGGNGLKPLAKTMNMLLKSSGMNDFRLPDSVKFLAIDMLIRSYNAWHSYAASAKTSHAHEIIKKLFEKLLNGFLDFDFARFLLAHLKGVRYTQEYLTHNNIYKALTGILTQFKHDKWISFENIFNMTCYRDLDFNFEYYDSSKYYFVTDDGYDDTQFYGPEIQVERYFDKLLIRPVLKGAFFFLAAWGLVEIKYDKPVSDCEFKSPRKDYITVYDGLKYVRMTELGKYVFGFTKKYTASEKEIIRSKISYDDYEPVLLVNEDDSINIAKIESYTERTSPGRYALSYEKIFRDCPTVKLLEQKVKKFYKIMDDTPPPIHKAFLDKIINRKNVLKKESALMVYKLDKDPDLMNIFMNNKKLQELVYKAEDYHILIHKDKFPIFKKIMKQNGYFIG